MTLPATLIQRRFPNGHKFGIATRSGEFKTFALFSQMKECLFNMPETQVQPLELDMEMGSLSRKTLTAELLKNNSIAVYEPGVDNFPLLEITATGRFMNILFNYHDTAASSAEEAVDFTEKLQKRVG